LHGSVHFYNDWLRSCKNRIAAWINVPAESASVSDNPASREDNSNDNIGGGRDHGAAAQMLGNRAAIGNRANSACPLRTNHAHPALRRSASPVPARASLPTPFTSRLFQVSGCLYLLAVVLLDPGSDVQGPGVGKEERASDEERVRIGSQRPGLRNKGLIITDTHSTGTVTSVPCRSGLFLCTYSKPGTSTALWSVQCVSGIKDIITIRAWSSTKTHLLDGESANKSGDDRSGRIVVGRNALADAENLQKTG
jgi:hypothetical protein